MDNVVIRKPLQKDTDIEYSLLKDEESGNADTEDMGRHSRGRLSLLNGYVKNCRLSFLGLCNPHAGRTAIISPKKSRESPALQMQH